MIFFGFIFLREIYKGYCKEFYFSLLSKFKISEENCWELYLNIDLLQGFKYVTNKSGRMVTNINQVVTQSLQRRLDQVTMQQNEEENVIEEKLQFVNDVMQFHTLEIIQYIMPIIPRIENNLQGT